MTEKQKQDWEKQREGGIRAKVLDLLKRKCLYGTCHCEIYTN